MHHGLNPSVVATRTLRDCLHTVNECLTLRLILTLPVGESSVKQAVIDEACALIVGTKVNEMFQLGLGTDDGRVKKRMKAEERARRGDSSQQQA